MSGKNQDGWTKLPLPRLFATASHRLCFLCRSFPFTASSSTAYVYQHFLIHRSACIQNRLCLSEALESVDTVEPLPHPDALLPIHALPPIFTTFVLLKNDSILDCSSISCILDCLKLIGGRIPSLKSNEDALESSSHYMNEFDYAQGRRQWQGEDLDLSSYSRRHESQQPVPLSKKVSGEIPISAPHYLSVRSTSGPLGPGHKHVCYMIPRQPG
ncbi:unnamed protein product [Lactuca virosa]|uniref:Uncharacterized protein n=1 Tax=Lactuca virosa TaxID=75947 RepID=A0AAU9MQU6_9ASTR|nr:unnamed protein product [Lactuca virosa]